jgi:hypothetical protein
VEPWLDLWRNAAIWTWGGPVAGPLAGDPKQLRSLWMAQATRTLDHYMRSTAFLELMHESMATMTRAARLNPWFPFK